MKRALIALILASAWLAAGCTSEKIEPLVGDWTLKTPAEVGQEWTFRADGTGVHKVVEGDKVSKFEMTWKVERQEATMLTIKDTKVDAPHLDADSLKLLQTSLGQPVQYRVSEKSPDEIEMVLLIDGRTEAGTDVLVRVKR